MDIQQKHAIDIMYLNDVFARAKKAFWVYNMFLGVFQLNALNNVVLMRKVKSQTVLRIFLSRSRSLLINIL